MNLRRDHDYEGIFFKRYLSSHIIDYVISFIQNDTIKGTVFRELLGIESPLMFVNYLRQLTYILPSVSAITVINKK